MPQPPAFSAASAVRGCVAPQVRRSPRPAVENLAVQCHTRRHHAVRLTWQMVAELGAMVGKRTRPRIANDITELIGNTPLLKLGRNAEGLDATILLKMESMEVKRGGGSLGGAVGRC